MKIRIQKISAVLLLILYTGMLLNSALHTHHYSFNFTASISDIKNPSHHSDPYLDSNKKCTLSAFANTTYLPVQVEDSESINCTVTSSVIADDPILQTYKGFSPQLRAPPVS